MLPDPLIIGTASETSDTTPASYLSLPIIGDRVADRVIRETLPSGGAYHRVSTSLVNTKENRPYGTKRAKLRIEYIYSDINGLPVASFVEVTVGLPKDGSAPSSLASIRRAVGQLLLYGDRLIGADLANGDTFASRLIAGEL